MKSKFKLSQNLKIFVFATLFSFLIIFLSDHFITPYLNIYAELSLSPILGFLGPFGSLGNAIANIITDFYDGVNYYYALLDFVTVFIISYLPYKLWTAFFTNDEKLIKLNSFRNLVLYVVISILNSFIYLTLYSLIYIPYSGLDYLFFTMLFLNFLSLSLIMGIIFILLLRIKNIQKISSLKLKFHIPDKIANISLYLALLISAVALILIFAFKMDDNNICTIFFWLIEILIILFFLKKSKVKNIKKHYENTISESFMLMFLMFIIIITLSIISLYYLKLLNPIDGLDELSLVLYINLSFIISLLPIILISYFFEKKFTEPVRFLSESLRSYISDKNLNKTNEELNENYDITRKRNDEIGFLSNSIIKITNDLEEYIENLKTLTAEQEKIQTELNIATKIQDSFIPKNFSKVKNKGVDILGVMIPAKNVGGDFYDFFMLDDNNKFAFLIGDVSDKGVPAALFMAFTKTLIYDHSQEIDDPGEIFTKINNRLLRHNSENMFVTAWMGILDLNTGELNFANVGHEPPLVKLVSNGGEYSYLKSKPGFVLGGLEGINYKTNTIHLNIGDKILLYTDGVTEANNSYEEFFGEEKLKEIVQQNDNLGVDVCVEKIKDEVLEFSGKDNQFDDITLLMIEYTGKKEKD